MASTSAAAPGPVPNGDPSKLRVKHFANGDNYHGEWKAGVPDGEGVYTWVDGSRCEDTPLETLGIPQQMPGCQARQI
eukprot:scaffold193861_cov31-Prasinocladus_malaysianus.AAC.1